jgi:hypothetical protein
MSMVTASSSFRNISQTIASVYRKGWRKFRNWESRGAKPLWRGTGVE